MPEIDDNEQHQNLTLRFTADGKTFEITDARRLGRVIRFSTKSNEIRYALLSKQVTNDAFVVIFEGERVNSSPYFVRLDDFSLGGVLNSPLADSIILHAALRIYDDAKPLDFDSTNRIACEAFTEIRAQIKEDFDGNVDRFSGVIASCALRWAEIEQMRDTMREQCVVSARMLCKVQDACEAEIREMAERAPDPVAYLDTVLENLKSEPVQEDGVNRFDVVTRIRSQLIAQQGTGGEKL